MKPIANRGLRLGPGAIPPIACMLTVLLLDLDRPSAAMLDQRPPRP